MQAAAPRSISRHSLRDIHVFVVADDSESRELLSTALEFGGAPAERARLLASGFQAQMSRPVDVWELCQLVQRLAARRR